MALTLPTVDAREKKVTIVSFSDFHGQFDQDPTLKYGGAAQLAGYIKKIKEISGEDSVIMIDGGDMFQGGLLANQFEGKPVITFFNQLGLTAAALGNHEFDYGPVGRNIFAINRSNAQEALRQRMEEAKFAILSANLRTNDHRRIPEVFPKLRESVIVSKNGVNVGIVGAITKETAITTNPINLTGLDVLEPEKYILDEAKKLKQGGADVLILAIHEGNKCENNGDVEDLSKCTVNKLFNITKKLGDTFDLIIGGHEGSSYVRKVGKTYVTQASEKATSLSLHEFSKKKGMKSHGIVYLCENIADEGEGHCTAKANQPWLTYSRGIKQVAPDRSFFEMKETEEQVLAVEELKTTELNVSSPMIFPREKYAETAVPNLFADVLKANVKDASIGVMNGGGIRTILPEGALLYQHIYEIFPFESYISSVDVTGKTLREIVRTSLNFPKDGYHWSGLYLEADETCQPTKILVNGEELNDEKVYRLALGDFLANGGGAFSNFTAEFKNKFISPKPLLDEVILRLHSDGPEFLHLKYFDPEHPNKKLTVPCPIQTQK